MKAFSNIIDEDIFYIEKDRIYVRLMDPSRICLMEVKLKLEGFKFYRRGEVAFDIENLAKILKCNVGDKATAELIFGQKCLSVKIISEKYKSIIERTLEAIHLEKEEIPFESLYKINYPCEFVLSKEKLEYLLRNLDGETVRITISENRVSFAEENIYSNGRIIWKKDDLNLLKCDFSDLERELNRQDIPENLKGMVEKIIENKECSSVYSLLFIGYISSMAKVIQAKDTIKFNIRDENPLRAEIEFRDLGDTKMAFFIAPRVEEVEFEDEDEDF